MAFVKSNKANIRGEVINVETLPVCQRVTPSARATLTVACTTHQGAQVTRTVTRATFPSSDHHSQMPTSPIHQSHDNTGQTNKITAESVDGLPPKPRTHRPHRQKGIKKGRSQCDDGAVASSETEASTSDKLLTQEPTRQQSILHRRVTLMELNKDDCCRSDTTNCEDMCTILEGHLENLPPITSKTVRVFLSSTFSDMVPERNALMEHVYPKLKDDWREKYGLEFQVVDLRWGVREEAQDDHATVDVCLQEIDNCQKASIGPSFVAFIGQKYGYRPVPPRINAEEFSKLRDALLKDDQSVSLLDEWYKIDRNSIPSLRVLQPITSHLKYYNDKSNPELRETDQAKWNAAFEQLQKLLRHGAKLLLSQDKLTQYQHDKYFISVTEMEIMRGTCNMTDPCRQGFAFYRLIHDLENMRHHKRTQKFIDITPGGENIDEDAQHLLKELKKEKIENCLCNGKNFETFNLKWDSPEDTDPNTDLEYLENFCKAFYRHMTDLIKARISEIHHLQRNTNLVEVLQHLTMCRWRSDIFRGREGVLGRVLDYLYHPAQEVLVVYGESGSGKTSVVAKAASLVHRWFPERKHVVILRFLGTTVRSCSIRLVLGSICWQMAMLYNLDPGVIPQDYPKLVRHFHKMLWVATSERPLVILLDSLDQLAPSHRAHNLSWVPPSLPPHVHMVLSTLPNMFSLLENLQTLIPKPDNFVQVLPLGVQLSQDIISEWLRGVNRTLTSKQFDTVREALQKCSLPLYTKLIFEEVCRWKSYSPPEHTLLADSVQGVINIMFDRVERYHGRTFVQHALSYLTASKNGLSDNELEDLLSLDDVVLDDVFEHWLPPIRRIPPLLWPRLLNEMSTYIMKREANGVIVFYWYHRQFISVAQERYLTDLAHKIYIHTTIAHYFLGTWGAGQQKAFVYTDSHMELLGKHKRESIADRKVPVQPLIFNEDLPAHGGDTRIMYNMRKLSELPYHLLHSRRSSEMKSHVLFSYEWLHAKLSCMGLQDVLSDYRTVLEAGEKDQDIALVGSALRVGGTCFNHNPDTLSFDLTGRLLPYYNDDHVNIRNLIQQCDTLAQKHSIMVPIYQCFEAPQPMLLYVLEDHTQIVFDLIFSKTTNELISVSKDNTIAFWDLNFGERTRTIDVSMVNPGSNTKLFQSYDGGYLVLDSDSLNSPALIFDAKSGQLIHKVGKKSATSRRAFISGFLLCREKNIIDVRTGKLVKTLDDFVETKRFVSCAITPNEKYILIGEEEQTGLFDFEMNVCLAQFKHKNMPCQFVITPDSRKAFIGYTDDCVFKVCDIYPQSSSFGKILTTFNYKQAFPNTKFLDGPMFCKELAEITVCEKNPNLVLLNVKRCHLILYNMMTKMAKLIDVKAINVRNNTGLFGTSFSMDGRFILAGSHHYLHVWSTDNCKLISTLTLHTNHKFPLALCLDKNYVATGSNIHTAIKVWDINKMQASEPGSLIEYEHPINIVASVHDKRLLFIKHYYGYTSTKGYKYHDSFGIDIWNMSTGSCKSYLPLASYGTLLDLKASPDALRLGLLLSRKEQTHVMVISTKSNKLLCSLLHSTATCFDISPGWDYAVTWCVNPEGGEIILWSIITGEMIQSFLGTGPANPLFSSDNQYLIYTQNQESIAVFSLKARDVMLSHLCEADILQAVPNHHHVVMTTKMASKDSLSDHSQVTLRNFHNDCVLTRLYGVAPGGIQDISKDGLRGVDGYLQVFDLKSGSLLCKFKSQKGSMHNVHITYDSRCIIWVDDLSVKVGDVRHCTIIGNISLHEKPTSLNIFEFGYIVVIGREDGHLVTFKIMNKGDEKLLLDNPSATLNQRSTKLLELPACSDGVIATFDPLFRKKPIRIKDSEMPKLSEDLMHALEQKSKVPHAIIKTCSHSDIQNLELKDFAHLRRGSSPCARSPPHKNGIANLTDSGSGTPTWGSPVVLRKRRNARSRSKSTQDIQGVCELSRKKSSSLQDLFHVNPKTPSKPSKEQKKSKRKSPLMAKAIQQTGQFFMALTEIGSSHSLPRKSPSAANREALRAELAKLPGKSEDTSSKGSSDSGRERSPSM